MAHVLWSGEPGGIERFVADLGRAQQDAGGQVCVAFGQARGPFVQGARESGLEVIDMGMRSGYDLRPSVISNASAVLGRADVVHLHGFNLPFVLATKRSRRPAIYTEHGFSTKPPFDVVQAIKRLAKSRFLSSGHVLLAANSRFTAESLAKAHGLEPRSIRIVHNGIDHRRFPASLNRVPTERLRVACLARLVPWKRVEIAIDAVAGMESRDVELIVIGDGPCRAALEERVTALHAQDRVTFLGWRQDVEDLLSHADVLAHPSRGEWFGIAVLEATALGLLPIVLADGGGVMEILPPDGEVVGDASELAERLASLRGSPRLSQAAREARGRWARETFPIARTADLYLSLYRDALAGRPVRKVEVAA